MRRVVPLLLVLIAAMPQAAFAGQWYRCRYTGETRTSCCCPKAEAGSEPGQAEVTRADCCDFLRRDPAAVTARTEPRTERGAIALDLGLAAPPAATSDLLPRPVRAPAERATAPPRPAEPLYIRHSSLLL